MIDCVVSRYKKNTDWVYNLRNINKYYIYDKENPENKYNIPVNKGNEASVYLKYIVDNYNNLADFTFLIHDDEYSWHLPKTGHMLFTGDACYTGDHWCDKCLPGLVASASDAADSVKKLRKVAKDHNAKVVWGHDPVTWLDWKKAPMFYYD